MSRLTSPEDSTGVLGSPHVLRHRMARDGYLFFNGLIPGDVLEPLRVLVRRTVRSLGWTDDTGRALVPTPGFDAPDFIRLQQVAYPSPELQALRSQPQLVAALSALLGEAPYPAQGDVVRARCAGSRTRPHQDAHYLHGDTSRLTAWFPLEPCPLEMGPLSVLVGSHREGLRPHQGEGLGEQGILPEPQGRWVGGGLRPGDAFIFHALTVHRSEPTLGAGAMRLSVDLRFGPPRPGVAPPPL